MSVLLCYMKQITYKNYQQLGLRITGLYVLRRLIGGSGFRSPRPVALLVPTAHYTHILDAYKNNGGKNGLPLFLFIRRPKRHIQPERYAKLPQNS
jgi:hypothetical protein